MVTYVSSYEDDYWEVVGVFSVYGFMNLGYDYASGLRVE